MGRIYWVICVNLWNLATPVPIERQSNSSPEGTLFQELVGVIEWG